MEKFLTTEDYCYRRVLENGGSKKLADKYLAYQNAGIKAANDLFKKVATHKVMGELFDLINEKCGVNFHYTFSVKECRGEEYIEYESIENLVDNDPLLALAWYKMHINNFNGGKVWSREIGLKGKEKHYGGYEAEDIDYSKPMEVGFSIDIHYGYEHIDGGTNGAKIGYAYYNGNEWEVRLEKDDEERKERRRQHEEWERNLRDK